MGNEHMEKQRKRQVLRHRDTKLSLAVWVMILLAAATGPLLAQTTTEGGTPSTVQATQRPLGLDIVAPVMAAGSDANAANFQQNVLPGMTSLVNTRLSETKPINDSTYLLDPSKLTLNTLSDVRVYFVGEGAGYHNSLGFNTTGTGVSSGNPLLIFPDASSPVSSVGGTSSGATQSLPLMPGDFVNLGTFAGGTKLDFFLIADGANGGRNVYSTTPSANPDGINHVVSFAYAVAGSPYLIIAFEDLYGGGDKDFNDVVIALDIGVANVAALLATPEPGLWLTLSSLGGMVAWIRRRQGREPRLVLALHEGLAPGHQ